MSFSNYWNKLFGPKGPTKEQILAEAVAKELTDAPRCPSEIAFPTGAYEGYNLLGNVAIPAPVALFWLKSHTANVSYGDFRREVIRKALLQWLEDADPCASSKLTIPSSWAAIFLPYLENFINAHVCQVYCSTCATWTNDFVYLRKTLTPDTLVRHRGRISICCPQGHIVLEHHWEHII